MGMQGLAAALVRLNLLEPLRNREGTLGIHPSSVCALLARLHQRVSLKDVSKTGISLRDGTALGLDADRLAWAVGQVVGGSLAAVDWHPPFDLSTLVVDSARLRALVDWPRSEGYQ